MELNLIEDIFKRDEENKIIGHYVRVKFLFSRGWKTHRVENPPYNTLSLKDISSENKKTKKIPSNLIEFVSAFLIRQNKRHPNLLKKQFLQSLFSPIDLNNYYAFLLNGCKKTRTSFIV